MKRYTPPVKGKQLKKSPSEPKMQFLPDVGASLMAREMVDLKNDIVQTVNTELERVDTVIENAEKKLDAKVAEVDKTLSDIEDTAVDLIKQMASVKVVKGNPGKDADEEKITKNVIARMPTMEEIISSVSAIIPAPLDMKALTKSVVSSIPQNKASLKIIQESVELDPLSIIDRIMALPEEKRSKLQLGTTNISGLDQTIRAFQSQLGRGYLHGGGLSTVSHDATLTGTGTPTDPLKVVGGGSGVSSFNTRTGAVTLTSGDVTTALGYTPLQNITGLVSAGTNVTITGTGVSGDPYVINSSGSGTQYWQRSGTTLSPLTAGDNIFTSGNLNLGTGTLSNNGLLSVHSYANTTGAIAELFANPVLSSTSASTNSSASAVSGTLSIDASNTQNWTGVAGLAGAFYNLGVSNGATGTVSNMGGIRMTFSNASAGLTVTNGYYFRVNAPVMTGAITNFTYLIAGTNTQSSGNYFIDGSTVTYQSVFGGSIGLGSIPTHGLTFASTNTGAAFYNTTDQTVNYERVREYWSGNVFNWTSEAGGTGTARNFSITGGKVGIGTAPSAFLHVLGTTEQIRTAYDASNYASFTTSSIGALTVTTTGTNPNITLTPGGTGSVIANGSLLVNATTPATNFIGDFRSTTTAVYGGFSNSASSGYLTFYADASSTSLVYPTGHFLSIGTATNYNTTGFSEKFRFTSAGTFGVGVTSVTALLHLKAGTATASTAPLKFTSGTVLATTEAGAIEYDGTHLYFTAVNAGTRYQLDQQSGSGTVTSVSVVSANGFAGTVATATTTPAITLSTTITGILKGNGTAVSAASAGTDYEVPLTFSTGLTRTTNTVTVNTSQNIATLSNLTSNGLVTTSGGTGALSITVPASGILTFLATPTSANLAAAVTDETGSGALVFATSPTLVTPALGTPTALVATNATGTATGLTSGITQALASATTTVNVSSATAPTSGQVLTATSGTAATWQTPSAGTTSTLMPKPGFSSVSVSDVLMSSNTTLRVGRFYVDTKITFTKFSFNMASVSTTGTWKVAIFSDSGASQPLSFTTASVSALGIVTTTVSSTTLTAGYYYVAILPNGTSSANPNIYTFSSDGSNTLNQPSGLAAMCGTLTVTASTMPGTITPTSITPTDTAILLFRLDA